MAGPSWPQVSIMRGPGSKPHIPIHARWLAVMLGGLIASGAFTTKDAGKCFKILYNAQAEAVLHAPPVGAVGKFIKRTWKRYQATGSVADAPRRRRNLKVPTAEARRLGQLLMAGTEEEVRDGDGRLLWKGHRPFTTMRDACGHSTDLAMACLDYNISHKLMLRHIHAACPELTHEHLNTKPYLTPAMRTARVGVCKRLLATQQNWLPHTTFIDCASYIVRWAPSKQLVYCRRGDETLKLPWVPPPGPARKAPVALHFIVAVHARLGLVYHELTTGTTDIRRAETFEPADKRNENYMVSRATPLAGPGSSCMWQRAFSFFASAAG